MKHNLNLLCLFISLLTVQSQQIRDMPASLFWDAVFNWAQWEIKVLWMSVQNLLWLQDEVNHLCLESTNVSADISALLSNIWVCPMLHPLVIFAWLAVCLPQSQTRFFVKSSTCLDQHLCTHTQQIKEGLALVCVLCVERQYCSFFSL